MSDATLLATAHTQVYTSLRYPEATREWERLAPAAQTWAAWQTEYREANVERLQLLRAHANAFGRCHHGQQQYHYGQWHDHLRRTGSDRERSDKQQFTLGNDGHATGSIIDALGHYATWWNNPCNDYINNPSG